MIYVLFFQYVIGKVYGVHWRTNHQKMHVAYDDLLSLYFTEQRGTNSLVMVQASKNSGENVFACVLWDVTFFRV